MLPSTGYFRGITCPEHLKRTCNRPYCHFRHDSKVSTEENASSSSSSSSLHTPVQEETEEGKQEEIETPDLPKDLADYSTTSLTPTISTPLEPELTHPQPHSSQQEESESESAPPPPSAAAPVSAASAPVPKSELLQQLMSEALKKVLAENPNLASTVDASSIRIGIDPVTESPPQTTPQGSPDTTKTKKQLYHRPPDTPSYNPTPIRELKKRKQSVDDVNEYFPTGANYSSVTEGKDSGDESTLLGAFSSDESEEEEKNNDDFDLLEEVLAEHSKNNKVKVKKKKVKELGKLQYSLNNTHKKTVDNSVLITDAKKLTDKEVKRYEIPQTESINKVITNGPYFLPPSPIFTSSSDGFEVFNSIVSQQEENLTPILDKTSEKTPTEIESETTNTTPSIDKKITTKTCTEPVKLTSHIDTEKKVTKASGHTHLPKLVSSIDPPKLSRPNIRAWNPLVRNNLTNTEKNNDHLDEMLQLMDGNEPTGNEPAGNEPVGNEPATKRKINETNHHSTTNQRDSKHIRPKKKYKVDLNKEIESLSNPAFDQSKRIEPQPNQDSTQLPKTKEDQETEEETKDKQTTEEEEETEEESDSNENSLEESDKDSDYKRGRYRKKRKRKRSRSSASESDYSRHRRKKRKRSHKRHRKRSHKRSRRRRESTSSEQSKDSEEEKEPKKSDEEEEEEEDDDDDIDEEEEEEDDDNKEVSESDDNDDDNDIEHSKKSRKHKRKHKYYKKHKKNKYKARRKRKRSKSYSRSRSTSESRDSSRSRSSRSRSRRSRHKSRNYTDDEKETSLSRSSSRSRSSSKHNKRRDSREDEKRIDDETGKNKKDERKKRDRTTSKTDQQTNAEEISMPLPVDPTKIKIEKNALIPDLSKVKIEKEDPVAAPEKQDKKETLKTKDNNKSESSHNKETAKINDRRRSSAEEKNKRRKSYERKESAENTSDKTHTRRLSTETKTSDNETGSQRKKTDERRSSGDKTKKTPSISSQPSEMSMFDLVLASAEPPKQKTLTETSIFDAIVNSNTNHAQESPITEKEKITSSHHDLKHKTKDVTHKSSSENAVKSSSTSDKTRSSRSDKNTHSDSHHKHSKSDKTSSHKTKSSSSNSSNSSSHHTAGSSSSHKKTSSTSSRVSSSKRHTTTTTTTTTSKTDNSTNNKSKKPSDLPTTKNEKETNKHSSRKHSSSSSSSSRHHDSSGKRSSSSSSSSKQKECKELSFDAALSVEGSKAVKMVKKRQVSVDEDSVGGVSEDDQVSLGGDSPLPDLSVLDEISQDDWELMLSGNNANTNQEPVNDDGDGDGDGDDDHDDPWVLEECMKVFNEFQPEANHLENQVLPKKPKVASDESEPSSSALSKQRVARSSSTGNLVRKHSKSRHQKTSPMQLMVERYQKLKEQLKLKEKQLHHLQGGPSTVSSSSTSTSSSSGKSSKGAPSSSSSSTTSSSTTSSSNHSKSQSHNSHSQSSSGKSKVRIAHVPNVSSLLTAHEKIKKQSPSSKSSSSSSSSKISAKVAKASGVIPETIAHTVMKGGRRVAHTPKLGVLERPMIQPELGSVVPQNVRQRYLNALIEECKKFVSEREAFNIAAAEERVCYLRARTRMVYLNLVVNAVKRLRTQQEAGEEALELMDKDPTLAEKMSVEDLSSTSSTKPSPASSPSANRPHPLNPNHTQRSHTSVLASGGIKGSWSIEKPKKASNYSQEALKGEAFYKNIQKYVLSEEELEENGYPFPDPEEKGKAIVKKIDTRKKISPSALERYCDRCSILYAVDKWGFPKSSSPCIYHWGRSYRKRKYGLFESSYSCCGGEQGSGGCCQATTHVSVNYNPKNLRGYVRTISKDNSSSNKEVYALDCEMCYTTEGNELTRITVISSNGDVVYEQLVKPENPILDYNTRFSGITEGDMEDVKLTIRDVQAALLARFSDKTILIGHSLESDLHSLKIIHNTVVDTSVVFPHKMGAPCKRALRNLAAEYLKRIIQDDVSGHDSAEDAVACLHLMQWKVKEDLKGFSK